MSIFKEVRELVENLDLKIERIKATHSLFPFMEHVVCRISTEDGKEFSGRGMAFDERSAFEKAIGEVLERYIHISDGTFPNTNGMALHTSIDRAKESAFQELIERDSYLCHFYTDTPFFKYLDVDLRNSIYPEVAEILLKHDFELKVARLSSPENMNVSVASCIGRRSAEEYGFSLGLSCKKNRKVSIDACIMEAVSIVPSYLEGFRPRSLTKDEFFAIEKVTVFDFAALAHHVENASDLDHLFSLQENFRSSDFLPSIDFVRLNNPQVLKDTRISVVKAKSVECQELFFDNKIERHINFERLKRFSNHSINTADIRMIPHYFA